jgi:outer membrane receptor protein involved in Fe transport
VSGRITDQQALPVAGATVTVESPALQGTRSVMTSANGDFVVPFLPPGDYTLKIELTGFNPVTRTIRISPSQTQTMNATMVVTTVTETVTVVGQDTGDFKQGAQAATSYTKELVDKLPLGRTLVAATLLAPGVQNTGPNGGVTVSGSLSYESLYLIDGVVVNENVRGQSLDLFIEDALQETTISTAGISAEYGRFGGGVVNAVTKSGGNDFSGSFRTTFNNDNWTALTPFPNDKRSDDIIPTYEVTLGGPVVKNRLWFFGAGRFRDLKDTGTTSFTSLNFDHKRDQKRYEGKITWSLTPNHTFKGAYTKITDIEDGNFFGTIMDLASLVNNRGTPQDLLSLNYTGILKPNFFVETQYSRRRFTFENSGSPFTDLVKGTLLRDRSRGNARYNSPTFCGVCDPENRDNQNIIGKATYFLSTSNGGSHNIVVGFDMFDDKRFANNHQSGSDYRIFTTSAIIQGANIFPVIDSTRSFIQWNPIFVGSQGNRFRTVSGFVNDTWTLSKRWTFNAGLRYDKNDGVDQTGNKVVKDSAFSPRLATSFDVKGDGRFTVNASYARYVAAIANSAGDSGSAGGSPATILFDYQGPAINTGNPANPVSAAQAITTVFDWFFANGGTNRPIRGTPVVPGVNARVGDNLQSPHNEEFALGFGGRLGSRGAYRVDGVYRRFRDFYSTRVDLSTGKVQDQFGKTYDLQITENTNQVERKYKGVNFQVSYRPDNRLGLGGNYTLSELRGNFEGEAGNTGPTSSTIQFYPEYFDPAWSGGANPGSAAGPVTFGGPIGDLLGDSRHKLRLWATWDAPIPAAFGTVSLGVLQYVSSGTPYGSVGSVDTRPYVKNPGYATPPDAVSYLFEPRDRYHMDDLWRSDLSLNWARRIGIRKAEVFFRGTILNVFNRDKLTNFFGGAEPGYGQTGCSTQGCIDTTILTNNTTASLAAFNPFTQTPVEGINWRKGTSFGKATSRFAYQTPRTYAFSVGFRF